MLIASVRGPSVLNAYSLQKKHAEGILQLEEKPSSSLSYGDVGGHSLLTLIPHCSRPDHREGK